MAHERGTPTLGSRRGFQESPAHRQARQRINLAWLMRLRWGAALGQLTAILATHWGWGVPLPMMPLMLACSATLASNLWMAWYVRRVNADVSDAFVGRIVALDICSLTLLLYFTGGPHNPFHFLYLVHMALAAMTLNTRWLNAIVCLSFVGFGMLFMWHVPLRMHLPHTPATLRQQGMGAAFASASLFIVYFVRRLSAALAQSESALSHARERQARDEKLTSLATLAAGAAHELATPLATIAVVAKEMERQLGRGITVQATEDARLIRQEVERCRDVLTQMAFDAGASTGESFVLVSVSELLSKALAERVAQGQVAVELRADVNLHIPLSSLTHALRAVVKNALEASVDQANPRVTVRVAVVDGMCYICVIDAGHGMPPEVLSRVSEPFFTTKGPGHGMGLGLFLTRTVLERLGGGFQVESQVSRGTTVVLRLPAADVSADGFDCFSAGFAAPQA
jgi:two-component system sensor histidine kinase RegB